MSFPATRLSVVERTRSDDEEVRAAFAQGASGGPRVSHRDGSAMLNRSIRRNE